MLAAFIELSLGLAAVPVCYLSAEPAEIFWKGPVDAIRVFFMRVNTGGESRPVSVDGISNADGVILFNKLSSER